MEAGIVQLLDRAGLGASLVRVPFAGDAPIARWVLQASGPRSCGDLVPGELLILEGSSLPDSSPSAEALAARLRGSGCPACLCARSAPPAAFLEASARAGLGILELPPDIRPAQAARSLALALLAAEPAGLEAESARHDAGSLRRVLALTSADAENKTSPESWAETVACSLPVRARVERLPGEDANSGLFLVSLRPEDDRGCREALRAFAAEAGLSLGLSGVLKPESSVAEGRSQALQALQLGQALMGPGHLSSYDNAALYLAYVDDGGSEPLLAFSRRTVDRIRDYDERTGGGLLPTLEAYFRNDRNARRTAAELGIQRHTLANRLARIETLTDYPLEGEGQIGYELALALRHWTKARISR